MTTNSEAQTSVIKNAEEIIERFGGIRPMSAKTKIPVTTIQGWKRRGAIPAARAQELLSAAKGHNVSLEGLIKFSDMMANQNAPAVPASVKPVSVAGAAPARQQAEFPRDKLMQAMAEERQKTFWQGVVASSIIALAIAAVGAILLWPEWQEKSRTIEQNAQVIATLQADLQDVKSKMSEQTSLLDSLPDGWQDNMAALGSGAAEMAGSLTGENAAAFQQRMAQLGEQAMQGVRDAYPEIGGILQKFTYASSTPEGAVQMQQSVQEINALLQALGGNMGAFETTLDMARAQSTTLGETFKDVPVDDLKAAALLLGLTQIRSTLNRDNKPFAEDLALLKSLIGQENPELQTALDSLAPQAQTGVLSPSGLTSELQAMTGDILVASLKGEDVSITEKAQARFGSLFKVEKDGELISGTPVQNKLSRAETLLNEGNLELAIQEIGTLEGPAAQAAAPWLERARATLQVQNVERMLSGDIMQNIAELPNAAGLTGGTYYQDERSGISLYRPAPRFQAPAPLSPSSP